LAGDTLNFFRLDERHVALYVLDVSGHGVAASLLAVTLSHLLSPRRDSGSVIFRENEPGAGVIRPAEVARLLSRRFRLEPASDQYFTIAYGVLALETGQLSYVCAGHPGPVFLPAGQAPRQLECPGLPIGVGDAAYQEHELHLNAGDRVYFFSDGFLEARNSDREPFGKSRLKDVIASYRRMPLQEGVGRMWGEVEEWGGHAPLQDDVSLLAVEFIGAPVGRPSRSSPRKPAQV
jgi:sigma-B regulation protein RsbU (phosphoserine phosphatase)